MKKRFSLMLIMLVLFSSMFIISCSDDDEGDNTATMNAADLVAYLNDNGMGLNDMLVNWIKTADAVNIVMTDADPANDYYIMDLRSAELYNKGHIPGAHNVALANVITDAKANAAGKTIAAVCYTGQSACHAVVALRLAGYSDAFSIKWGMSGWHTNIDNGNDGILTDPLDLKFDYWTEGTAQLNHANWVAAPGNAMNLSTIYDYPAVSYEADSEEDIIMARAQYVADHFQKVSASTVLTTPTDYFINNYWAEADVQKYGNIDGAYRIFPIELNKLDPTKKIVTYCWTGQTSSIITAYLTALGYDAWSLGNGANAMIYDDLVAGGGTAWHVPTVDLPLEGTLAK